MPQIAITDALASDDLLLVRATCDGQDDHRLREERCDSARLWLVAAGAFKLRDRRGSHVVDPTTAVVLEREAPFTISHPHGGDICISLRGPLVDALADGASATLPIEAREHAALLGAVRACRDGDDAELEIAELVAQLRSRRAAPPNRKLARDIAALVRLSFAQRTSLAEIARTVGTSVFHACRVFRGATGATIHAYRNEVRLRHALALLVDGDDSIADIALATGFAGQSHLTNAFRRRFAITPGRVRMGTVSTSETRAGQVSKVETVPCPSRGRRPRT
ncbi:MAG TPA: AraC family transcriptional regulator [Kofleriaceae bacterium]